MFARLGSYRDRALVACRLPHHANRPSEQRRGRRRCRHLATRPRPSTSCSARPSHERRPHRVGDRIGVDRSRACAALDNFALRVPTTVWPATQGGRDEVLGCTTSPPFVEDKTDGRSRRPLGVSCCSTGLQTSPALTGSNGALERSGRGARCLARGAVNVVAVPRPRRRMASVGAGGGDCVAVSAEVVRSLAGLAGRRRLRPERPPRPLHHRRARPLCYRSSRPRPTPNDSSSSARGLRRCSPRSSAESAASRIGSYW